MDHARLRYLEGKRSVDARAIDRRVRDRLLDALPDRPRVFDAGCGTGVTLPRLLSWGVRPANYLGVDSDETVIRHAREARPAELRRRGHDAVDTQTGGRVDDLAFEFRAGDAVETAADSPGEFDLVVAQAFMDLVEADPTVTAFERALAPGGLAYFPITFDGGTLFQPDHPADAAVERAYHDHIDSLPGRDSHAGRHLLTHLDDRAGELLAAAGSDWVIRPRASGYPADEAAFLDTILGFVTDVVEDREIPDGDDWVRARRRQLANGELVYVAHQYDLLYRAPD